MRERGYARRWLALENVEASSVQVTAVQRPDQSGFVDDFAAGDAVSSVASRPRWRT